MEQKGGLKNAVSQLISLDGTVMTRLSTSTPGGSLEAVVLIEKTLRTPAVLLHRPEDDASTAWADTPEKDGVDCLGFGLAQADGVVYTDDESCANQDFDEEGNDVEDEDLLLCSLSKLNSKSRGSPVPPLRLLKPYEPSQYDTIIAKSPSSPSSSSSTDETPASIDLDDVFIPQNRIDVLRDIVEMNYVLQSLPQSVQRVASASPTSIPDSVPAILSMSHEGLPAIQSPITARKPPPYMARPQLVHKPVIINPSRYETWWTTKAKRAYFQVPLYPRTGPTMEAFSAPAPQPFVSGDLQISPRNDAFVRLSGPVTSEGEGGKIGTLMKHTRLINPRVLSAKLILGFFASYIFQFYPPPPTPHSPK